MGRGGCVQAEGFLMNMHIHIWTPVNEKDNRASGPATTIQSCSTQRDRFYAEAWSEMAWREARAPLSVPESGRQEVVLQKAPYPQRFP